MENVKDQRFEHSGGIVPSMEVEGLEPAEGESVLHIVENKTILSALCPLVEPVFEFADDFGKVRDCALIAFQHVHALNSRVELSFLFEVQAVAVVLYQDSKQREKELEILAGRF